MKKQNIVLVGFRGVGKSKFGRALAEMTGLPFADLDTEVEFILGESIISFVEKHGWQVFRAVEQRVTHDFSRNFSGVIATGGGTIENSKNLQNLKKNGAFVFLNPSFLEVKKYLMTDKVQKKCPRAVPDIPLSQEIDQMWIQRKDIYAATADVEVQPDFHGTLKKETKKILEQIPKSFIPSVPPHRKVVIFSSSNGTVLQGLLDAQKKNRIPNVEFVLFVTDKPSCGALKKAREEGIKNIEILEPIKNETREEYDRKLINLLREHQPDMILLAGWMRILSGLYCEQYRDTTFNVHPSLLPKFSGLQGDQVHEQVLDQEEGTTGCTVHRILPEVDTGETVLQRKVIVEPEDTVESLRKKVQKQEILGFCELMERR